jgi:ribosomal protein S18 acetylase RimI-like enzyme
MSTPHQITGATINDIAAIVILVNSAYRGDNSKKGWTTEADLLDGLRTDESSVTKMIEHPESIILKCSDQQGQLLGCVYLKKDQAELYLGMLTVSPQLQAQGIGKQLLTAAENHAKQAGCLRIIMTVISVRHELIGWYQRHGYQPTGQTQPFPDDPAFGLPKQPLYFIVMEKYLQ